MQFASEEEEERSYYAVESDFNEGDPAFNVAMAELREVRDRIEALALDNAAREAVKDLSEKITNVRKASVALKRAFEKEQAKKEKARSALVEAKERAARMEPKIVVGGIKCGCGSRGASTPCMANCLCKKTGRDAGAIVSVRARCAR